jgi:uncharacterized membrane protein
MSLGWHFLIPLALANLVGVGVGIVLHLSFGWGLFPALLLTTLATLAVAIFLVWGKERHARLTALPSDGV